jgi:hypothetical protein
MNSKMWFFKNIILLSAISFIALIARSQPLPYNQKKVDSLLQLLPREKNDSKLAPAR